jgi:hypothetical protein
VKLSGIELCGGGCLNTKYAKFGTDFLVSLGFEWCLPDCMTEHNKYQIKVYSPHTTYTASILSLGDQTAQRGLDVSFDNILRTALNILSSESNSAKLVNPASTLRNYC